MYESLKKVVKSVLPESFFQKNEDFLRKVIALRYRGNKVQCNICQTSLSEFVRLGNGDLLCPACGSVNRTRRLLTLVEEHIESDKSILHFSPPKGFRKQLKKRYPNYITSDLVGEFDADKNWDILNLDCPNNSFDAIICYHILEHIIQDTKAMSELHRVLAPGGICFIQTPFKTGEIYEDETIILPEDRLTHFGQEDHVRIYSVDGLIERLKSVGFEVEHLFFPSNFPNPHGFRKDETVLLARKR